MDVDAPFPDANDTAPNLGDSTDLFGPTGLENDALDHTNPLSASLPHAEDMELDTGAGKLDTEPDASQPPSDGSVFLAASMDGNMRIWDKRKATPIAKILPKSGPPWCMGACWSPDGNFIYAGRRNGTVEEYSLHKGLHSSERTFRFPNGSGPVSAVRAMPNGRHLVW